MKTNKIILAIAVLFLSAFFSEALAQQNLKNWTDKVLDLPIETKGLTITVIDYKDPKTKKEKGKTVRIKYSDATIKKELIEAYFKDKPNTYMSSEKRSGGATNPDYASFFDNNTKTETQYSFKFGSGSYINVTIQIMSDKDDKWLRGQMFGG